MDWIFYLVALCFLIFLSCFNYAAEISIVSQNRIRLRTLAKKGDAQAREVLSILARPERLFSTILVANTLIHVSSGSIACVAGLALLGKTGTVIFPAIVIFVLAICDITSKTYSSKNPERVSSLTFRALKLVMFIMFPLVKISEWIVSFIIRLLSPHETERPLLTKEELHTVIKMGEEEGVLNKWEREVIHRIFDFSNKKVRDIMTPREAIDMVDANLETKELIDRIIETGHRRVPLYIGTLDNVVGIAYTKDLLMMLRYERVIILQDCLSQPHFVEEETRVIDLLRAFQHSDIHLAIVRNKEKRVVGLVDLDDLFGEIVGEIVRERALPVP